jgi:hypothetical protein
LGIESTFDHVQVHAAYYRLILTQATNTQTSIFPHHRFNPKFDGNSYVVKGYDDSHEIALAVDDIDDCSEASRLDEIIRKITQSITEKVSSATENVRFCIFNKQIQQFLASLQNTPQSIGVGEFSPLLAAMIIHGSSDHLRPMSEENLLQALKREVRILYPNMNNEEFYKRSIWSIAKNSIPTKKNELSSSPVESPIGIQVHSGFRHWIDEDDQYHKTALKLSSSAIGKISSKNRSLQALTTRISEEERIKVREEIDILKNEIIAIALDSPPQDNIYQFNIQFFPLTSICSAQGSFSVPNTRHRKLDAQEIGTEWVKVAIRELVGVRGFRPTVEWVMDCLYPPVDRKTISRALDELKKSGVIRVDQDTGKLALIGDIETTPQAQGEAIEGYHKCHIKLALSALLFTPPKNRVLCGITFPASRKAAIPLQEVIYKFFKKSLQTTGKSKNCDRIYQLNTQFFPLLRDE